MDILAQTSLLVALTSFALGASVLARNVKNKLYLAFAVLTVQIAGWAFCFFFGKLTDSTMLYRLHLFFNLWIAPAALGMIQVMVRIHDQFSQRLFASSTLLAIAMSIALALRLEEIPWVLQLIYYTPVLIMFQIIHLMLIDRRLRRGWKRLPKVPTVGLGRRNLIYFGGMVVLATSVMDHVTWVSDIVPAIGNFFLTIYLFFLSQAVTQQRLLNFGALLSRFLVLLAASLILTGVYLLPVAWGDYTRGLFFLNSFIASFLLLMLLEPLRKVVTYFTQRLLTQEHRHLEQTLREAQRKLAGIVDLGTLFHALLQTVEQTLRPEWAALYVLRGDGTKYRRVRSVGIETPSEATNPSMQVTEPVRELLADHPLLEYCEKLHRKGELPILLDQILEGELDRSASRVQRENLAALIQALKALGGNLLIPLFDGDKILGFLALRVIGPPEPWGNNWGLLPIIYPFFEQVAQAMSNMEVYVRQRERERLAALGEMAAGLAHEIRNPLGAIKGAAQFLDPSADRPESRFLRVIVEEVDRLNRVVTQFLDYSKPPAEDLKTVDIAQLAERTVEMMKTSEHAAGVRFEFSKSARPARVLASPEQLQQVLLNLIQNAVKALDERVQARQDAQIRVIIESDGDRPNGEVTLSVEDNGKGIKKEHLDKLFIPFFTTSPSGTGLGLSISHKIVEAHRGRIEVATELGKFTRFSVVLPYAPQGAKEI